MDTEFSVDHIATAFCDRTLPKSAWTHTAHLKVGLWHLLHYSPTESLARLRDAIRHYNLCCGVANTDTSGYHESLTCFYVVMIAHFLTTTDRNLNVDMLAAALVECYGAKDLPLNYWSRDRLFSVEARLNWVEPDLVPLPNVQIDPLNEVKTRIFEKDKRVSESRWQPSDITLWESKVRTARDTAFRKLF